MEKEYGKDSPNHLWEWEHLVKGLAITVIIIGSPLGT